MGLVSKLVDEYSLVAREKRAHVFRSNFNINKNTKILDLGSEDGSSIARVLCGTDYRPENVFIADIKEHLIRRGATEFGFTPVLLSEDNALPFEDGFFDIVYCSSVIEHVTIPKDEVWRVSSEKEFEEKSLVSQRLFAEEIKRVGRQYFVQTPYKYFPIESHSWLPFLAFLPREILIWILRFSNLIWVKRTSPDWSLFNRERMERLFSGAYIAPEYSCGFIKSFMAIKAL